MHKGIYHDGRLLFFLITMSNVGERVKYVLLPLNRIFTLTIDKRGVFNTVHGELELKISIAEVLTIHDQDWVKMSVQLPWELSTQSLMTKRERSRTTR